MSLYIGVESVVEVLLADGWHKVAKFKDGTERSSFNLYSYEFCHEEGKLEESTIFGGGQDALISATGAAWFEADNTQVSCPLTSILAVRSGDD